MQTGVKILQSQFGMVTFMSIIIPGQTHTTQIIIHGKVAFGGLLYIKLLDFYL